jgi:hypothetical protein
MHISVDVFTRRAERRLDRFALPVSREVPPPRRRHWRKASPRVEVWRGFRVPGAPQGVLLIERYEGNERKAERFQRRHPEEQVGGGLARGVSGYIANFWSVRLALPLVFDVKEYLTAWWLKIGDLVLTLLFASSGNPATAAAGRIAWMELSPSRRVR